jgi:hypothetical protein
MSSSRRDGDADTSRALARSSLVVVPMAETTTQTCLPLRRVSAMRAATCLMRAASATEEPPYFWTTIGCMGISP